MPRNFLSVDVEDWHHSAFLRKYVNENNFTWRVDSTIEIILELFHKLQVHATFFVVGEVAKKFPDSIRKIHDSGHEIASHGFSHTPLWYLNKASFRDEIHRTNDIISPLTNRKVIGFRAPYASLNQETSWALDVLRDAGFRYDSSIFPMKTPLYGVKNAPLSIYRISAENIRKDDRNGTLIEVPFSVYKGVFGSIPVTGGIYGRFLPYFFLRFLLKRVSNKREVNFYFHPWEVDPNPPKIQTKFKDSLISYYGVDDYLSKIEAVINSFEFDTFENNLKHL